MLDNVQGCLLGVMIGDAMGMPVELMSASDILVATKGAGIVDFNHPIQRNVKGTRDLDIGSTTDDWQLTECILKSLVRRQVFDLTDIALAHVEAYETSTFGWGGTTRDGMAELQKYFETRGVEGRNPFEPPRLSNGPHFGRGAPRGLGNGVAMKIAPIAIFSALGEKPTEFVRIVRWFDDSIAMEFSQLAEHVAWVGGLTHADPRAWSAAYAVALIIAETLLFPNKKLTSAHIKWMLTRLIKKVESFEEKYPSTEKDVFSKRLRVLNDFDLLYGPIESLRTATGVGCLALESACFAIAIFMRNPDDFRKGILEAVNSGGDADTTAAMAGSMIGAAVGASQIPHDWTNFNPAFMKALTMGSGLIQALT